MNIIRDRLNLDVMYFRLGRGMESKKRKLSVCFLWLVFIIMVVGIVYLSFQNGDDTKALSDKLVNHLAARIYPEQEIQSMTKLQYDTITYQIRQGARVIGFLLIGIVGTVVIHISCPKCNWLVKTVITAVVLFTLAYFTEKFKIYIPTRHYSYEQMLLSIIAVAIGFITVSIITLTVKALKGFYRWMEA